MPRAKEQTAPLRWHPSKHPIISSPTILPPPDSPYFFPCNNPALPSPTHSHSSPALSLSPVILGLIAHNSITSWIIFEVLRNALISHWVDFSSIIFLSIIWEILIFLIIILIYHHNVNFLCRQSRKITSSIVQMLQTLLHLIQLQANIFLLHTCNQLHVSLPFESSGYLPSLLPQPY